jgi:uncharacterized protein YeaO (DUF488 family)
LEWIVLSSGILYTNNFSSIQSSVGLKFGIMRFLPEWIDRKSIKDNILELAPSDRLLDDWRKKRISWEMYTERYMMELCDSNMVGLQKIEELLDKGYNVTLHCTCSKKVDPLCHRFLLRNIFGNNGYRTMEIPDKKNLNTLIKSYESLDEVTKVIVYNLINRKEKITELSKLNQLGSKLNESIKNIKRYIE